jgi:ADP-heptose:LPS heptosyltransferase
MIPWRKDASKSESANRVLVIQLGGLADFVAALAAARLIREAHIGARITVLTTEATRELAELCPYFDTVEADGKPQEPQAITKLIARIRAAKYDMIYDLEGSSRTKNYFQGLRPWPPKWSGAVAGASHAYLDPDRGHLNPLDRYAAQLAAAGLDIAAAPLMPDLSWLRSVLRDPPRLRPDFFGIRGDYVLLLPRGADAEPNRRWPQEKYSLGITVAQLALAWVLRLPVVTSAIAGARRPGQIEETVLAGRISLSAEVVDEIEALLARR